MRLRYVVDDSSPLGNPERSLDLATAPDYQLFFSCFMGDLELVVGDADLSTAFGGLATLGFAVGMVGVARRLTEKSHMSFLESEDRIDLSVEGSRVRVSCTYRDGSGTVARAELVPVVEGALRELLDEQCARYPGLAENPVLANALREVGFRR
jgi:hypothetical protein